MVEEHLQLAQSHVAQGVEILRRQRKVIADLERNGRDPTEAERLLTTFEETQNLHIADVERLEKELAAFGDEHAPR